MTCVVGVAQSGVVYMGADSAGAESEGDRIVSRLDPKLFRRGPYLIGFEGSYRIGQLLAHVFNPPSPPDAPEQLHPFLVREFIPAVRECFQIAGVEKVKDDVVEAGTFMLGVKGRLFVIEDDYQVAESADRYSAIGSGDTVALGALFATAGRKMSVAQRLTTALEAAAQFNMTVRAPWVFERINK